MSCTQNGYLGSECLRPLVGGYYAAPGPAAAWNAMAHEIYEAEGVWIRVNGPDSAYRSFVRQQFWRNYWCSRGACQNAAVPGTSNHGLGWAFDVPAYVSALLERYGAKYGFRRACSDAPWESWHWKWCGGWTGGDPGNGQAPPAPTYPTLRKGDQGEAVKRAQKHLRRWNLGLVRPEVDGDFGERTADAVRQFQIVHGMKIDGIIGPSTWRALRHKDHFLDDERSQINRIRFRRHDGVTPNERPKIERGRDWCQRRAQSIKQAADHTGWDMQHRRQRYKVLNNLGK